MAFLDNSGDIILDAVLTDIGRKRMAMGDFKISKFAIGDDEIDYGLYNKNHPSGSAYYDLEILQAPVLEAFTQVNANINYGLTSFTNLDLLYLPSIKLNTKANLDGTLSLASNGVLYLTNPEITDASNKSAFDYLKTDGFNGNIMKSSAGNQRPSLLIETGIDTGEITPTATNQAAYILSKGLQDQFFKVSYDPNYIGQVKGPDPGASEFGNLNSAGGNAVLDFRLLNSQGTNAATLVGEYSDTQINGVLSRVYYHQDLNGAGDSSTSYSAIAGPRSNFTLLALDIANGIAQETYTNYGKLAQSQGSGASSKTYDYIDTTVYINGGTTNVSLQIPVRIIKIAGA